MSEKTKFCGNCKKIKPITDFHKRGARGRQPWCKTCSSNNHKKYFDKHVDEYHKSRKLGKTRRRMIARIRLMEYLRSHPCVDCGETDPIVLSFDHIPEWGTKEFDISTAVSNGGYGWERIEKEINKCQVRCCNCHQKRTAKSRKYYKTKQ